MPFQLSEEQEMFRKSLRNFLEDKLAPGAAEIDEKDEFPRDVYKSLSEIGIRPYSSLRSTADLGEIS